MDKDRRWSLTGWQALGNAVVEQAVKDYKDAIRRLKKNPKNRIDMLEALALEDFFHSDWYTLLTNVDADYLIDRLRKAVVV